MNIADFEIDFQNAGRWPLHHRIIALIALCLSLALPFYFFSLAPASDELAALKNVETGLINSYKFKALQAATLDAYQQQLNEMDRYLDQVVSQLPRGNEIARFLSDISQVGMSNGLVFESFNLDKEIKQDLYVELPIAIRVKGDYHGFAAFINKLASLPHIATIHNIKLSANTMEALIKTYHQPEDHLSGDTR